MRTIGKKLVRGGLVIAAFLLVAGICSAQEQAKVQQAMGLLLQKTAMLGTPSVKGTDVVAGKTVPALYFGGVKMNNNFDLVDEIQDEIGGTATLFVKSGGEYFRVATNIVKEDGTRAIGTILDPQGEVIKAIEAGTPFYGEAEILGKSYETGYEPIRDASGEVIGIYFVGYEIQD